MMAWLAFLLAGLLDAENYSTGSAAAVAAAVQSADSVLADLAAVLHRPACVCVCVFACLGSGSIDRPVCPARFTHVDHRHRNGHGSARSHPGRAPLDWFLGCYAYPNRSLQNLN
jgi:hypothetical protein